MNKRGESAAHLQAKWLALRERRVFGIRLAGSVSSFLSSQPTWLAVFEALGAGGFSIYALMTDRWTQYLVLGTIVAPLFLLRTRESVTDAIVLFEKILRWDVPRKNFSINSEDPILFKVLTFIRSLVWLYGLFAIVTILFLPTIFLATLAVRAYCTAWRAISQPIKTLTAIPQNWYRQVLCLDLFYPPELLPEIEAADEAFTQPRFSRIVGELKDLSQFTLLEKAFELFWMMVLCSLWFLPAIAFRLSFKASSAAWVPLLWCVSPFRLSSVNAAEKLEDIRYGVLDRIALSWSTISILAFLIELHLSARWNSAFASYLDSDAIWYVHRWQLASCISGVFAWVMFLFADKQIRAMKHGNSWAEGTLLNTINGAMLLRRLLALYTLSNAVPPLVSIEAQILFNIHLSPRWFSF